VLGDAVKAPNASRDAKPTLLNCQAMLGWEAPLIVKKGYETSCVSRQVLNPIPGRHRGYITPGGASRSYSRCPNVQNLMIKRNGA